LPAPELDHGRAARFLRIELIVDLLLDKLLQLSVDLFGQFPILPGLAEQVAPETG